MTISKEKKELIFDPNIDIALLNKENEIKEEDERQKESIKSN